MSVRVELVGASVTTELRRAVLRPAWAPGSTMPGDADPAALHVAALGEDDAVLGGCVLFPARCPHHPDVADSWQLRGMATADGHRGAGVGAAVLAGAVEVIRDRGAGLLWCKARVTAAEFYAAHGFAIDGADYLEPETGVDHRDMSRSIAPT